jgi:hypothetical protein
MPRIELERLEQSEDLSESSTESFDRIAFAERAVALVRPPNTTVAICERARGVHVSGGRQWGKPPGARWAVVSIAPNASRRAIASAVLALYDGAPDERRASRAWALDVLMTELGRPAHPCRAFGAIAREGRS